MDQADNGESHGLGFSTERYGRKTKLTGQEKNERLHIMIAETTPRRIAQVEGGMQPFA